MYPGKCPRTDNVVSDFDVFFFAFWYENADDLNESGKKTIYYFRIIVIKKTPETVVCRVLKTSEHFVPLVYMLKTRVVMSVLSSSPSPLFTTRRNAATEICVTYTLIGRWETSGSLDCI